MTNFARIIENVAVDVSINPPEQFHPSIAAEFQPVPDEVQAGWVRSESGEWIAPEPTPQPEPAATYPKVSPVEFLLLFTISERVAIREKRQTDPVIDDFFNLVEDPRLTHVDLGLPSTQVALNYFAELQLIADHRIPEILSGKYQ